MYENVFMIRLVIQECNPSISSTLTVLLVESRSVRHTLAYNSFC